MAGLGLDEFRNAAESGRHRLLKKIIADGYDVNRREGKGKTPLMKAAHFGELEAVKALVAHGAIVDQRDDDGNTALFWATIGDEAGEELMSFLVKRGANVNVFDNKGASILMYAIGTERPENVRFLLANGADPYLANEHGQTPVDIAKANNGEIYLDWFKARAQPENKL